MNCRHLTLAFVLMLVAFPALAQLHKCIDERGRTQYTDKPVPGCKPVGDPQADAPAKPAAKAAAPAAAKPSAKAKPSGPAAKPYVPTAPAPAVKAAKAAPAPVKKESRTQLAARCKSMQQEYDWLVGPRGEGVEARKARIEQVKQGMRGCP